MNKELQDKLFNKYPKIFRQKDLSMKETAMCWGISCGDGWYNILDILCGNLQSIVDKPHEDIEMYKEWVQKEESLPEKDRRDGWIEKCNKFIEDKQSQIIPQLEAVQVKEKYGTLRFYLSGYPENPIVGAKVDAYINFAEDMSAVTCEKCGMPGELSSGGWMTVSCDKCK